MAQLSPQRAARWLVAFVLLLILIGSLQPFRLRPVAFDSPLELLTRLRWGISTPADLLVNVLLYLPLGAALLFALPQRLRPAARVAIATGLGTALSLAVEMAQWFIVTRVASLADVAMNASGALLGAAAGALLQQLGERLGRCETLRLTREPFAAALVLAWVGSFLPAWLPRFAPSRWPADWAQHLAAGWPGGAPVALQTLGWLTAGAAVHALTRPAFVWPLLATGAVALLAVRLTWLAPFAGNAEPIGAGLALLVWPLLARLAAGHRLRMLAATLAAGLAYRALAPFTFGAARQRLHLVPFTDLVSHGSTGFDLPLLFGKAFWYGGLVWLMAAAGTAPLTAGLAVGAGLGALELAQVWTPAGTHVATLTDPAIALSAGIVLRLLAEMRRRPPAARRAGAAAP